MGGGRTLLNCCKKLSPTTKSILILSFYIFIPIFFQAIFPHFNGIYLKEKSGWILKAFFVSIIEALALIFPLFIFPKIIKIYTIFLTLFIHIPYFISLCHIIIFKQLITRGALMAICDTNTEEATGFIKQFTTFSTVSLFIFFVLLFILTIKNVKPFERNKKFLLWQKFSFIMLLISVTSLKTFSDRPRRHQLTTFFMYYQYRDFANELVANNIKKKRENIKPFVNITDKFKNKKTTFVVVIGESAGRKHFQLYGYNRETNPLLSKRNDIYTFSNIETPHAQTLPALQKVLSFAYGENNDLMFTKGSIVNYFKDAGFKTFWISNQEYGGRFASYQTIIGDEADFKIFGNSIQKEKNRGIIYDIELNEYLKDAIEDKADKKIIFIHLRGSHGPYESNYSSEFNIFKGRGSYKEQQINTYDNSIIYNDFVINNFIEELKKQNQISYLLYFSDHGEDAGDTANSCFCHHDGIRTESMLQIPFILWVSPEYKKSCDLKISKKDLEKPYNTENLIHTIIKLSGLSNPDFEKKKSLL